MCLRQRSGESRACEPQHTCVSKARAKLLASTLRECWGRDVGQCHREQDEGGGPGAVHSSCVVLCAFRLCLLLDQ